MVSRDLIGTTIGSYRIVQRLGVGGMGAVYLGEHMSIGHVAAIKVLHPLFAGQAEVVERFFNEARAVNAINHQSLVDIHHYGQQEGVGAYLVMEYLDGENLEQRLLRDRRLPLDITVSLVRRIASPLTAAHERGIIHRDLKPANIFLLPDPDHPDDWRVKLLDFGIAKLTESSGLVAQKTKAGTLLGTPLYMSPEQCQAHAIDHRTDIYALGIIAYEMICGRAPFHTGSHGRIMAEHISEPPPAMGQWVAGLPAAIEEAVRMALAKSPGDRFGSARAFANALAAAARIEVSSSRPHPPEPSQQIPKTAFATGGSSSSGAAAPSPGAGVKRGRRSVPPTTEAQPVNSRRAVPPTAQQPAVLRPAQAAPIQPRNRSNSRVWLVTAALVIVVLGGVGLYSAWVPSSLEGEAALAVDSGASPGADAGAHPAAGKTTGNESALDVGVVRDSSSGVAKSWDLGSVPTPVAPEKPPARSRHRSLFERVPAALARAYRRRHHDLVLKLAARRLKRHPRDRDVMALVAMTCCRSRKKMQLADQIYLKLRGSRRRMVARTCQRVGVPMGR